MTEQKPINRVKQPEALFGRVVSILDAARGNVVRAVNTQMVLAYWLIGREIVQELQGGEERATYGKQAMSNLSKRLAQRYGEGFSVPNLQNFMEVVEYAEGNAYRAVYAVRFSNVVYVLRCFQKKSPSGIRTAKTDTELVHKRLKAAQQHYEANYEKASKNPN